MNNLWCDHGGFPGHRKFDTMMKSQLELRDRWICETCWRVDEL